VALAAVPSLGADSLDEVLVQADRYRVQHMREELLRLEDGFYATFNKLNTDNQFDIICEVRAGTGTVIRRRSCRPRFEQDANAADFQAWWMGNPSMPPAQVIPVKRAEMQRRMIELLTAHPELRAAVTRYHDYKVRYEELLKKEGLSAAGYVP
jgi:hypothetical protein